MKEKKTMEFVGSIFGAIIGLVIMNTYMIWQKFTHGVVLDTWFSILWAANLSMVVSIIGNLLLAVYRPARLYSFVQLIISLATILSAFVFYTIFPVDFSQIALGWINNVLKILTIMGMVGGSISVIVYLVWLLTGKQYQAEKNYA
jgi:hypothetical protein